MCLNSAYQCNCLSTGNQCEPCRMTAKDRETEEDHLSNNNNDAAGQEGSTKCEPDDTFSSTAVGRESGRNWGWMLSGIIAVNILILGCALVSGSAFNSVGVSSSHLQSFLISIILLNTIWMLFYCFHTARKEHAVVYKDGHAGPVWLRGKELYLLKDAPKLLSSSCEFDEFSPILISTFILPPGGLVLFGILSIIMDIFKIASYVGYLHCDSAVKVAFPVIQLIYITVQVRMPSTHTSHTGATKKQAVQTLQ